VGRRGYPPEFRRRVLDLVASGRSVCRRRTRPGTSEEAVYTWRRQDRVDRGLLPGLTSVEKAELAAAKRRIAELEAVVVPVAACRLASASGVPHRVNVSVPTVPQQAF